jgi:hypothetical protein
MVFALPFEGNSTRCTAISWGFAAPSRHKGKDESDIPKKGKRKMSRKFALIIGNTEYADPGLAQLTAPGKDVEDFARILKDPAVCGFDEVNILLNQPSASVIETVDEFFDQKKPDDLLVLYFSGHGVRDEIGSLYLAVKNSVRSRLRSTAIKSDYIREAMDQSRSKRQVVILECCNSGAFPQGTKGEVGGVMGMTKAFQGYGRFVLTASDATQFAWEGDKVIGETDNSLFTHFLVKGLEGEADSDGDGRITVDEIYDYTYQQISRVTPKQTPTKSSSKQEGEIVLRENMRIEDIKPIALSDDLINEIEDTRPYVREAAVQKLEKILKGKNIGLARSAMQALEKIAVDENTTRRVAQSATQALESVRQVEQKAEVERGARDEAERLAMLKAEEERVVLAKADAERKAREEAQHLAAQKAAEERLAREKVEAERKAKEEVERLTAQKAEEERIALAKAESERKAREEAQRLAAQKAAEERLVRERAEAVRLAREHERKQLTQAKPALATALPTPAENVAHPQSRPQQGSAPSTSRTGVQQRKKKPLTWLLFAGGGLLCLITIAIAYLVWTNPPSSIMPTDTQTDFVPVPVEASATPTYTNTLPPTFPPSPTITLSPLIPPSLTFTFTPKPTNTPSAPTDPVEFVRFYFDTIVYQKDFEKCWSLLTPDYQTIKAGGWDQFITFWNTVKDWSLSSIMTEYNTPPRARVLITYRLYYYSGGSDLVNGSRYCLLWNDSIGTWQIDLRENCP